MTLDSKIWKSNSRFSSILILFDAESGRIHSRPILPLRSFTTNYASRSDVHYYGDTDAAAAAAADPLLTSDDTESSEFG